MARLAASGVAGLPRLASWSAMAAATRSSCDFLLCRNRLDDEEVGLAVLAAILAE